jgi:hypothetical protein
VRPETPALELGQPMSQTMRGLTNPTTTMFGILKRLGVPSKQLRIGQVEC